MASVPRFRAFAGVLLLGVATLASVSLAPSRSEAQAEPRRIRVVVERFSGPQASRARAGLVENLGEEGSIELVEESALRDALRSMRIRRLRTGDYPRVARELRVDAFVDGRVSRQRRGWALTVRVRRGDTGEIAHSAGWSGSTVSALTAIRRNGFARLREGFEQIVPAPAPPPTPPRRESSVAGGDVPWYQRREVVPREPDEEPDTPDDTSRYDALVVSASFGALARSFDATATVHPRDPAEPPDSLVTEPRRYQSAGVGHPEVGLRVEVFPGAFGAQAFPYLGLVASVHQSLLLTSFACGRRDDPTSPCLSTDRLEVPTSAYDLYLGARGRYRLGERRGAPEFHVDIGYGIFAFLMDMGALEAVEPASLLPPMNYSSLELAAGLSFAAVPTYLSFTLDARYRVGLDVGVDAKNVWGVDTTVASGWALGVSARTELPQVTPGFFVELQAAYHHFATQFRGPPACVVPMCEADEPWPAWPVDVATNEVVGGVLEPASDGYVRWGVALGFALR